MYSLQRIFQLSFQPILFTVTVGVFTGLYNPSCVSANCYYNSGLPGKECITMAEAMAICVAANGGSLSRIDNRGNHHDCTSSPDAEQCRYATPFSGIVYLGFSNPNLTYTEDYWYFAVCCGSGDPCCGNPDPCCGNPDPCCGDPKCCGDPCCEQKCCPTDIPGQAGG